MSKHVFGAAVAAAVGVEEGLAAGVGIPVGVWVGTDTVAVGVGSPVGACVGVRVGAAVAGVLPATPTRLDMAAGGAAVEPSRSAGLQPTQPKTRRLQLMRERR